MRKIYCNDRKSYSTMRNVGDRNICDGDSSDGKVLNKRPKLSKSSNTKRSSLSGSDSSTDSDGRIFGLLFATELKYKYLQNMNRNPTFGHGLISVVGRQRSMEDRFTVFPDFINLKDDVDYFSYDFFAVFDGHGGHKVSHKCRERLHRLVVDEVTTRGGVKEVDWESVMCSSFARMDAEVADGEVPGAGKNSTKTVGSTALVVVVGKDEIVVANCGDCRVVLFRDGFPLPLSHDHLPERADEKERVEAAGGNVVEDFDCSRVLGVLSTSRSIGDYPLKPYLISEPEVQVTKRTPSDDFLVIATDGIWDVLTNEVVVDLVKKCFNYQISKNVLEEACGNCAGVAAAMLVELAIARGSKDNISVIVVQLNSYNGNTTSST